jgi:hypothetical protein
MLNILGRLLAMVALKMCARNSSGGTSFHGKAPGERKLPNEQKPDNLRSFSFLASVK